MHPTRTRLLAALVPLALAVAACGDDDATGPVDPVEATAVDGETAGTGVDLPEGWTEVLDEMRCQDTTVGEFPRTVEHDGGETSIEAEPERIVSIEGTTSLDLLLLMGVTPAAAGGDAEGPALLSWQAHLAGGSPTDPGFDLIQKRPEVNVEAIAAARPDLIISQSGWLEGIEPRLRELGVPIVVFEWGEDAPDWRRNARIVAEATGRDACDDEIVAVVEDGIEEAGEVLTADVLFNLDFYEDGSTEAFLQQPTVAPIADRVQVLDPDLAGVAYYPSPLGVRLFVHDLQERLG